MKKNIFAIVLCCILLILEILPLGAGLHIDGKHTGIYCSCFSLEPLLNGNFAPLPVAILSAALLILSVVYCISPGKNLEKVIFFVSCIAMLLSLCPLLFCMWCYSFVACIIALILFILTMMFVEKAK